MRGIFLNSWALRQHDELKAFIEEHRDIASFMAFSEVFDANQYDADAVIHEHDGPLYLNGYDRLCDWLPDFEVSMYSPNTTNGVFKCTKTGELYERLNFGNAFFLNTNHLLLIQQGECEIYNGAGLEFVTSKINRRTMHWAVVADVPSGEKYLIAHFHGLWIKGNTKGDAEERRIQSENVVAALQEVADEYGVEKVVLGGDFNLSITTNALRILETGTASGTLQYRNLIREHRIRNTRTSLYRHYHDDGIDLHADYVLTSLPVQVEHLAVPDIPISDHRPLLVEFQ